MTRLPKGLFADGIWQCNCTPRLPAEHFKVKKEGNNKGRWFYTCQHPQPKRCDFFLWDEDAKPREEAAVLSGKRTEPCGSNETGGTGAQEGWSAGRGENQGQLRPTQEGMGMFKGVGRQSETRDPDETDSDRTASPPPPYSSPAIASAHAGTKRNARTALMDDEDEDAFAWPLSGQEERDLVRAADAATPKPETPHKVQKTGVYATPGTTGRRKLPWEMPAQPATPASESTTTNPVSGYFQTPSKRPTAVSPITEEDHLQTPTAAPAPATARTPSPPSRHRNALSNPADSASSLTSEALSSLSSVRLPPDILSDLRSVLSKHDLKTQGITRGRDISRLALKAKEAKIAELQMKIESLQADMELDRGVMRQLRWQAENGRREEAGG